MAPAPIGVFQIEVGAKGRSQDWANADDVNPAPRQAKIASGFI